MQFRVGAAAKENRPSRLANHRLPVHDSGSYEAFRQGLRDLGYIEGHIVIERANASGKIDRLADAAAELVRLNVDVIVTTGSTTVFAAKQATSTIPIVMTTGNPLATGIITSLARPGGNITGLTNVAIDLAGKRLELLKEAVPKITRVESS